MNTSATETADTRERSAFANMNEALELLNLMVARKRLAEKLCLTEQSSVDFILSGELVYTPDLQDHRFPPADLSLGDPTR